MNSDADDDIHYSDILGESSYHCLDNNNIHCSNVHLVVEAEAAAAAAMDEVQDELQVVASNNHAEREAVDESVEERMLSYDSMSSWGRALYSMHDHPVEPISQGAWLSSTPPC
jgi:hypothetical protein